MSFFERYFAALDGPDPYASLDLVAEDLEFAIEWAAGPGRKAVQVAGGRRELREFIDAGDRGGQGDRGDRGGRGGWAHYLLGSSSHGRIEFALGETRYDSGERIGTFVAVAELDDAGRMRRYLVGRTPALAFG